MVKAVLTQSMLAPAQPQPRPPLPPAAAAAAASGRLTPPPGGAAGGAAGAGAAAAAAAAAGGGHMKKSASTGKLGLGGAKHGSTSNLQVGGAGMGLGLRWGGLCWAGMGEGAWGPALRGLSSMRGAPASVARLSVCLPCLLFWSAALAQRVSWSGPAWGRGRLPWLAGMCRARRRPRRAWRSWRRRGPRATSSLCSWPYSARAPAPCKVGAGAEGRIACQAAGLWHALGRLGLGCLPHQRPTAAHLGRPASPEPCLSASGPGKPAAGASPPQLPRPRCLPLLNLQP